MTNAPKHPRPIAPASVDDESVDSGNVDSSGIAPSIEDINTSGYPFLGEVLGEGAVSVSGKSLNQDQPMPSISKNAVINALKEVYDPELPVNIYDLGLIYDIIIAKSQDIEIIMTLTTPNCPVAGSLPQMIADQAASVDGAGQVTVKLTWEPPWDISRMSDDARMALGFE